MLFHMSFQDWGDAVKKMETGKLGDIRDAIGHLSNWKEFRNEYAWTGIFTIGEIVKQELELRRMKAFKRLTCEKPEKCDCSFTCTNCPDPTSIEIEEVE